MTQQSARGIVLEASYDLLLSLDLIESVAPLLVAENHITTQLGITLLEVVGLPGQAAINALLLSKSLHMGQCALLKHLIIEDLCLNTLSLPNDVPYKSREACLHHFLFIKDAGLFQSFLFDKLLLLFNQGLISLLKPGIEKVAEDVLITRLGEVV